MNELKQEEWLETLMSILSQLIVKREGIVIT